VSIREEIEDSFEQGEAEADEWKEHEDELQSLYDIFTRNSEFIIKNPDLFLLTENVRKLSRFLGRNREKKIPILLHGPLNCGKSTIVQLIAQIKKYNVLYHALDGDLNQFASWWEKTDFSTYDIVIFDNVYSLWDHLTRKELEYLRSKNDNILVVGVLNSCEKHWLQMETQSPSIPFFNQERIKEFELKRYSTDSIREMVKRRLESVGKPDLFSKDVLDVISVLSLGLPGLAFWLISCMFSSVMSNEGLQSISVSYVHEIADYIGFGPALKLVIEHNNRSKHQEMSSRRFWPIVKPLQQTTDESSPLIQFLLKKKQVSTSWAPLLGDLLFLRQEDGSIKRSELQERTGVKESSLTYQCQRLVQEKIISYSKEGREVQYQLRSPVKEALELTFFG
jgi:hypothetical protein